MRSQTTLIPSLWDTDWIPLPYERDGNVPGPVWKPISSYDVNGACTYLMHLPPNWHDEYLDWHPGSEEGFVLSGATSLGNADEAGYGYHPVGNYCYRPPGILHGPARAPGRDGATLLQRMGSELRILRYDGDEFPHRHRQPITDEHLTWPVAWEEEIDTPSISKEASTGGWEGCEHRWVYRNTQTGGGAVIIDIPAGWEGRGSAARGSLEEFVLEGSMSSGGSDFGLWGYAYRQPGEPAGHYASQTGAQLMCFWEEANELEPGPA